VDSPPPQVIRPPAPPLSTGSLRLDLACGGGIFPGEVVEICGPPESGKSALCLRLAAGALQAGEICAWVDADWTFEPVFAGQMGIPVQAQPCLPGLVIARPRQAGAAIDMLCRLAAAGPRLIVIDSLNALTGEAEIAGPPPLTGHSTQKLLSLALRSIAPALARHDSSLVIVRQGEDEPGAPGTPLSAAYHGLGQNLERLSTRLHRDLILRLQAPTGRAGSTADMLRRSACVLRPRSRRKNGYPMRISPCLQFVDFDIMYKQGIIRTGEVFDLGIETGSILLREGRYTFQDQELGLGRANAIREMDRRALTRQVEQVVRQRMLQKLAQKHR